jgi:2-polyprenyl-3-methyl-5-hydroxy-6-metoxy-1,4-benzoquinol methylase
MPATSDQNAGVQNADAQQGKSEYRYDNAAASHTEAYLWPPVLRTLERELRGEPAARVFDLGCGNGAFVAELARRGYRPIGVDPSSSGIRQAKEASPDLDVYEGSAYDDLRSIYGQFPAVVSLEVVEHVYAPRSYAATLFQLVEPGGVAIVSTPYHGYWKNFLMAVTGKLDAHFTALWDHGHIKFWSVKTLSQLLQEVGFQKPRFEYGGRIYPFSKSMIAVARKTGLQNE